MTDPATSVLTHPWSIFSYQLLIFAVRGFSIPSSTIHMSSISLMFSLALPFYSNLHERMDHRAWKALLSGITIDVPFVAIATFLVDGFNFADHGPRKQSRPSARHCDAVATQANKRENGSKMNVKKSAFWFAIDQTTSRRYIETPRQIKIVLYHSTSDPP